jgi:hypothetical protein
MYCVSLKFSGPEALKIPVVRSRGPRADEPTPVDFCAPADPLERGNRGGLSVFETLHLVSDIAQGYQMF